MNEKREAIARMSSDWLCCRGGARNCCTSRCWRRCESNSTFQTW